MTLPAPSRSSYLGGGVRRAERWASLSCTGHPRCGGAAAELVLGCWERTGAEAAGVGGLAAHDGPGSTQPTVHRRAWSQVTSKRSRPGSVVRTRPDYQETDSEPIHWWTGLALSRSRDRNPDCKSLRAPFPRCVGTRPVVSRETVEGSVFPSAVGTGTRCVYGTRDRARHHPPRARSRQAGLTRVAAATRHPVTVEIVGSTGVEAPTANTTAWSSNSVHSSADARAA